MAPGASPHEPFDIEVPIGDPFFDPFSTGTEVIPLERSAYNVVAGVRQQINALSAYVDASNVYGSDAARALELRTLDGDNQSIPAGPLSLAASFFNPQEIVTNGIDPLLRGLAQQKAQNVDSFIVDEVRNFLFGPPGAGGFDLASLNIQRGREHGLPSFNQVRVDYGLPAYTSFAQVNPDPDIQARLAAVYATVDDIDPWVGGLSEAQVPGALVGETLRAVLGDQFERLRDGDRFYYESYLPQPLVALINTQTLSRIIRRNTGIGNELQLGSSLREAELELGAPRGPARPAQDVAQKT